MAKRKPSKTQRAGGSVSRGPAFIVDPEFRDLIPPPTSAEVDALFESLRREGRALVPLVVGTIDTEPGKTYLFDGHTRRKGCEATGAAFTIDPHVLRFPDRDSAKAWIFANQISRRNLTEDQVVMLAAMRGVACTRGTALKRERAATLAAAGKGGPVLENAAFTIALAWGAYERSQGRSTRRPRPATGPTTEPHHIPEGHELKGVSTRVDADGEMDQRWDKTQIQGVADPEHDEVPAGHLIKRTSTMRDAAGHVRVQWVQASADEVAREKAMREAWERFAAQFEGRAAVSTPPAHIEVDLRTEYLLGDPHIGMLAHASETGDHFDLKIACRELAMAARLLVAQAPPSFEASVVDLGDFFHAQDDRQVTPGHGHKLDVDGRHSKVFDAGCVLLIAVIDAALERHGRVIFRALPGNHDPQEASRIATVLRAWYRNDPRVTIADAFAAYQYDRFGKVLFGYHHGDGAKAEALPGIMAADRPDDWGQTTERHWHCGHVHHLVRKEFAGCVVESWRTLAGKDAWHAAKGYRAGRSLSSVTYHREFGEVSRQTVNLARVRAALAAAGKAA